MNKRKNEPYKIIMIALFAAFLIGLPVATLVTLSPEAQPFSENENRYLARFPKLSFQTIEDESFMEDFDEWISDRFIGRESWIVLKNNTEMLIGKEEINGVFTADDRMMQVWRNYDVDSVQRNLDAMNKFAAKHEEIPMYFMLVPSAQEIYSKTLLSTTPIGNQKAFIKYAYDELTNFDGTIDVYSLLNNNKQSYIYYRTDHHWTSFGAYLGYAAAAGKLNYTAVDFNDFTIEHASSSFRGTLFSKTLDSSVTPDIIDYYSLGENEPSVTLNILDANGKYTEHDGLYYRNYLERKDKYSSFLGPNQPIITVKTDLGEDNDRSILIIKDSYAHSMIPFLTKHFSTITVMDLRYINVDFQNFVSLEDYDEVLFIYNVITFSEDTNIKKLNLCK